MANTRSMSKKLKKFTTSNNTRSVGMANTRMDKSKGGFEAIEVDLDKMKWVDAERTIEEYAVFVSELKCDAAIKPDAWAHPWTTYERLNNSHGDIQSKKGMCSTINIWYFPHDCLIDNNSENGALMNILED
ncbi:hypothetical protein QVD17_20317 [Tagetes erecta]|uniref:Uncharacterized protein n=1 Tax=Tagetes erecta TaxID=13708 RepID=A0AAD8KSL7_TARER|nr:hypothetical protein QVD17_20317 [Tagetes erecta]